MSLNDDQVELDLLRAGSPEATRRLVDRSWGRLVARASLILGGDDQAQDVVQESLIAALQKLDDFEPRRPGAIDGWVQRIVTNRAINHLRKMKRLHEELTDYSESYIDRGVRISNPSTFLEHSAEDIASNHQIRDIVLQQIAALPDSLRSPLVLRDIEGFSTRETAECLQISENNVKIRLHRGRLALKEKLERTTKGENL